MNIFLELSIEIWNIVFYVPTIPSMESTHLDVKAFIMGLKAPITNSVKAEITFDVY